MVSNRCQLIPILMWSYRFDSKLGRRVMHFPRRLITESRAKTLLLASVDGR